MGVTSQMFHRSGSFTTSECVHRTHGLTHLRACRTGVGRASADTTIGLVSPEEVTWVRLDLVRLIRSSGHRRHGVMAGALDVPSVSCRLGSSNLSDSRM